MLATKDLRAEHVLIARIAGVMDVMAGQLDVDEAQLRADFRGILGFLTEFVDRCHHTKEEIVLFPAIQRAEVDQTEPVIRQLLAEHEAGRSGVRRMASALDEYERGRQGAMMDLLTSASDYAAFIGEHIELEESCCFDDADERLPQAAQEAMAEEYERIEREVGGHKQHEKYHALAEEIEARYLQLQPI